MRQADLHILASHSTRAHDFDFALVSFDYQTILIRRDKWMAPLMSLSKAAGNRYLFFLLPNG